MEGVPSLICRLCLKESQDFEIVEETHQEVFNAILLELNLAISDGPVICKTCAENLQKCFAFKTVALYIRDRLTTQNAARDVCLFCNKSIMDSFVLLNSDQLDILLMKTMIEQYFPELDLQFNPKPIACTTCYQALQKNFDFIVNCLSTEQQIIKYCERAGTNNKGQVQLRQVAISVVEDTVLNKNDRENSTVVKIEADPIVNEQTVVNDETTVDEVSVKVEPNFEEEAPKIKVEETTEPDHQYNMEETETKLNEQIKIEDFYQEEENPVQEISDDSSDDKVVDNVRACIEEVVRKWGSYSSDQANCDNPDSKSSAVGEVKSPAIRKTPKKKKDSGGGSGSAPKVPVGIKAMDKRKWWANVAVTGGNDSPLRRLFSKSELKTMIARIHVAGEKKYQCQVCHFIAKAKCSMNRHMVMHQDPSDMVIYECHDCGFKAKRKADLVPHVATHREPSQRLMYKCEYCPYQSKVKCSYKLHLVKHKICTDVRQFECYTCGYKTYHKKSIQSHVLSHMRQRRFPKVHKCDRCNFQTRAKTNYDAHILRHMHPSEVKMYKCDLCNYESKFKALCRVHMERHREPIKCTLCDYRNKSSGKLRRHWRVVHKLDTKKLPKIDVKQEKPWFNIGGSN